MREDAKYLRIGAGAAACAVVASALFYMSFLRGKTARASPAPELLSALPAGAPTLIYIDLAAVRASSFYQHRPDRGPIAMPNRDYADFVQSTGFDFEKDLDRVAIASWATPSGNAPRQNVLIAEGRFDRAKIREYALHHGKLDHQEGRDVFLFPGEDRTTWNSVTFLDDHRIAMVAGPSISPLVSRSDDPATDPARERAARLDGAAAFAITRVPPIPDNLGPGGAQSTQLANLVRSVRWVTLAARPEGDDLRVSLEGECDTGEDARQLRSTIEVMRMFGRAALDGPKTKQSMDPATNSVLQTLLSNAEVTESGERVRVLIELTPEIFHLSGPNLPNARNQGDPKP